MMKDEAFGIIPILGQQIETGAWTDLKYLLIQHWAGHWGFPKGHAEAGESAIATACREFEEETGIQDYEVLDSLAIAEQYSFVKDGQTVEKTVTYYLARVRSEAVTCQAEEVQAYVWSDFETALTKITFEQARKVLQQANAHLTSAL
ncbi:MAG: NUDIX domain-containing protein [Oculatellaceae cyanobacterium Prado106]|nr:NUDIX domain-containing protein [Oculatellaceae cyanobacterium Prado106]